MRRQNEQVSFDVPLAAPALFVHEVRQAGWFTPEEEMLYVRRLVRGNIERTREHPNQWVLSLGKDARNCLAERYQSLVIATARKYAARCRGMDWLDLVQEANVALMRVLDGFQGTDEANEPRCLGALVTIRIDGAVRSALRDHNATIRVAAWVYELRGKAKRAYQELALTLGREPSRDEVAQRLGISVAKLMEVEFLGERVDEVQSLQALPSRDGDEALEDTYQLVGLYGSAAPVACDEVIQVVQQAMQHLSARQRQVITLLYGLDGVQCPTVADLARELETPESNVWKIVRRAKLRLHKALATRYEEVQQRNVA